MRNINMILGSLLFALAGTLVHAQECASVSPEKQKNIEGYLRKQYQIPDNIEISVVKDDLVSATCYRQLTFEGKGPVKSWQLKLYLSPDQRFLSSELLDLTLDPVEARRRKNKDLMTGLVANSRTSRGPAGAAVTIVEFSDFECPLCRRLAEIMDEVLPETSDQVRVVFHHMPLSMHPWARLAAEGAGCAQLQNSEGFWAMHDQLFLHQKEITPSNMREKLLEYAGAAKSLDLNTFKSCLDQEMSLGTVLKDINLAEANDVNSTPTLFVNGERIGGVRDADQLRQIIAKAAASTASSTASSPSPTAANQQRR